MIGLDQASKWFIHTNRIQFENLEVIKGFFYLTYCENRGAAFSILQNFRWGFVVLTVAALVFMIRFMIRYKSTLFRWSMALLFSGALGNMLDRALKGYVVDFFHFYPFGYDFAIFNVADIFINIGVVLLIIFMLFVYKEPGKGKTPSNPKDRQEEIVGESHKNPDEASKAVES